MNPADTGGAFISGCVLSRRSRGDQGWPEIPQLGRDRARPEPLATWLLVQQAQNCGGELGVSGCGPHLMPMGPFAKALSSLLGFLIGAAEGFTSLFCIPGLYPGLLTSALRWTPRLPLDGLCLCAATPDLEPRRCCSELFQDHPSSSSLDHDLAARDVSWG